jgi:hypothetical protein
MLFVALEYNDITFSLSVKSRTRKKLRFNISSRWPIAVEKPPLRLKSFFKI